MGVGVLLAAWGISLLWRYTPPEIAVRVKNPELHVLQDAPLTVKQDTPFVLAPPAPLKVEPGYLRPPGLLTNDRLGSNSQAAAGDIIKREVTVFSYVQHGQGSVTTGWSYKDGRGDTPVSQFCYYIFRNPDQSSKRVDLANDGIQLPQISLDSVPDLEVALSKCRWWR
jgi:hypothetical protein